MKQTKLLKKIGAAINNHGTVNILIPITPMNMLMTSSRTLISGSAWRGRTLRKHGILKSPDRPESLFTRYIHRREPLDQVES